MFFTVTLGILIIVYCVYNLVDIKMFTHKFHGAVLESTIDAYAIVGITLWLLIQFFMQSAVVNIIPLIFLFAKYNYVSERKRIITHTLLLLTIIFTVSFVVLNFLYFNINLWGN